MLSIKIIILLLAIVLAIHGRHHHRSRNKSHHLKKILKSSNHFFRDLNKNMKKVINGVFESLNLSKQFSKQLKIKILLTMHADLKDIAEKNFELFDVLRNASVPDIDNKPVNQIRLNEFIAILNKKKEFNVHNQSTNDQNSKNTQRASTDKSFKPEFANSKEFKEFIGAFIGKIRQLTVDDLFNKKESRSSSEEEESGRRNLQVWEPPERNDTGMFNMTNRRIYGGRETDILSHPFIVSIHIDEEFVCAGSIISQYLIITAASCLQVHYNTRYIVENPKNTFVRLGSDWTSWRGELVPVLVIYFYPRYEPQTLNHNIAIMRIVKTLKLPTTRKITRVLLDRDERDLHSDRTEIKILGWGAMQPNKIVNQFGKLNYAVLKTYPIQECQNIYSKSYVSENHFCAGFKIKKTGACSRDVGGPGMVGNYLVGIISFGAAVCGSPNSPTVFTRVSNYIDWIDHILALQYKKYGVVRAGKKGNRILIFYKKPLAQADPFKDSLKDFLTRSSSNSVRRLRDTQGNPYESAILRNMAPNHHRMMLDDMHHEVYDDTVDIFKPEDGNISKHPLIDFLLPGVHYKIPSTTTTTPSTTTPKIIPTFMFRSTPLVILRAHEKSKRDGRKAITARPPISRQW